ncbi:Alpha/Beta hydrolase protein [Aspergillus pseudoustus]|uniref:Alpha/Beta hydrolase protein n=1 Tax=Aspergillus pseudoustus TaxID=1810923 RepID=A0ABR4ITF6_9EURO
MPKTPTPHSQFVNHANGQITHYIIDDFTDPWKRASTETILIQHGFGRHFAFWYHWIPVLARKYRVIRRDLRGHGLSSDPTSDYDYSLDTVLGEIVDLLDQEKTSRVHLLSESTGGMIGIAFAAKYPERLLSLTTCATPSHLPDSAKRGWALEFKDWPTACRELGARGFSDRMASLPGSIGQADPAYQRWWLDQADLSTGEGFARYAEFLMGLDVRPWMADVRCPVLILAPTNSRNTSLHDQEALKDMIPGSTMVTIDGRGHEIYVDKAEDCQAAFLRFLGVIASDD